MFLSGAFLSRDLQGESGHEYFSQVDKPLSFITNCILAVSFPFKNSVSVLVNLGTWELLSLKNDSLQFLLIPVNDVAAADLFLTAV